MEWAAAHRPEWVGCGLQGAPVWSLRMGLCVFASFQAVRDNLLDFYTAKINPHGATRCATAPTL